MHCSIDIGLTMHCSVDIGLRNALQYRYRTNKALQNGYKTKKSESTLCFMLCTPFFLFFSMLSNSLYQQYRFLNKQSFPQRNKWDLL